MTSRIVGFTDEQRRKDQRREVRDTFVVIDGTTCKVTDMSLRSFRCVGYKNPVKPGDDLMIDELLLEDNSRVRLNAPGMVIRFNKERKDLVGVFVDISSTNFDVLERLIMKRPMTSAGLEPPSSMP